MLYTWNQYNVIYQLCLNLENTYETKNLYDATEFINLQGKIQRYTIYSNFYYSWFNEKGRKFHRTYFMTEDQIKYNQIGWAELEQIFFFNKKAFPECRW